MKADTRKNAPVNDSPRRQPSLAWKKFPLIGARPLCTGPDGAVEKSAP